jgi:thymidylate kinase
VSTSSASSPLEEIAAPSALALIAALAHALADSQIAFCHWKSNADLERSLSGDNDLDLLVRSADRARFRALLSELGFVEATSRREIPAIESFLGFDAESERIVHVHAHYELVLGDDRTKNYRLPIEEAYISSARNEIGLPVPAPEFELVVLVVRMALKYLTWDEIAWRGLRGGRAGPTARERMELEYLRARARPEDVAAVVDEQLPTIGRELFDACLRPFEMDVPVVERTRTARRLEIALQAHARLSRRADRARRIGGRLADATARRVRRVPKKRLASGGAMVAIVGGDGAGKSTALADLDAWLSGELDVRLVHLGKPPWSATTYGTRAALKVGSWTADALGRMIPSGRVRHGARTYSSYRPLFWLLCTARDRKRAFVRARRFTVGGGLVLCDRYPHPRLVSMEAPLIRRRAAEEGLDGRIVETMARTEERYHRSIEPPELLVVLRLDPEVAVSRKHTERSESVRKRGAEVWNIDWRASDAHVVDAGQPADAVLRELRRLVWSVLAC